MRRRYRPAGVRVGPVQAVDCEAVAQVRSALQTDSGM